MPFVNRNQGFSLIELLISLAIMLIVSGSAFTLLSYYQKSYISMGQRSDIHSTIRAAMALMTQEITQAGSLGGTTRTIHDAVTKDTNQQSVTLDPSADGIFDKEKLVVGTGTLQEIVEVQSHTSTSITGIFAQDHAAGTTVMAVGVFPEGILPSSSGTQLRLVGDLNGDGTMYFGWYDCDPMTGNLTRTMNKVSTPTANGTQLLLNHIVANPTSVPCFQYTTTTVRNFTLVTGVAITISAQTSMKDPRTGAFVTVTESLLNISPRNLMAGLEAARSNLMSRLQPTLQNCNNPTDPPLLPCIPWPS
jgi:prepilin-type N-terminal cleavage/methylation domain-containing protein